MTNNQPAERDEAVLRAAEAMWRADDKREYGRDEPEESFHQYLASWAQFGLHNVKIIHYAQALVDAGIVPTGDSTTDTAPTGDSATGIVDDALIDRLLDVAQDELGIGITKAHPLIDRIVSVIDQHVTEVPNDE